MFEFRLAHYMGLESAKLNRRFQQKELAKATGIEEATISKLMSGKPMARIEARTVIKLARYFGCNWYDLVEAIGIAEDEDSDPKEKAYSTAAA